jgi:hypothetical protein
MNTQTLKNFLIGLVLISIIGGGILWLNNSYQRMKGECERMGGSFYSISFSQNICVDGTVVHELK